MSNRIKNVKKVQTPAPAPAPIVAVMPVTTEQSPATPTAPPAQANEPRRIIGFAGRINSAKPVNLTVSAPAPRVSVLAAAGTKVEGLMTAKEVLETSGLNWPVTGEPIYLSTGEQIAGHKAIVRGGEKRMVLAVAKEGYRIIPNHEALDLCDKVVGEGSAYYESAGELKGGRKIYVNLRLPANQFIDIAGDKLEQRLLMATSHDGSMLLTMKCVTIRVVCQNTLSAALREMGNEFKIRHTGNAGDKIKAAREALGLASAYFDNLKGLLQKLDASKFSKDEMAKLTLELVPKKEDGQRSTRGDNLRDKLIYLFESGTGNDGQTRWDALNAVTEFVDHERSGRAGDAGENEKASNRLESVLFTSGATLKQKAFDILTESLN